MKIPNILDSIRFVRYKYNKKIDLGDILSSGLSASTKPVIWTHVNSLKELDMLQPVLKQFAKQSRYTILVTYHYSSVRYTGLRGYDYIDYLFTLPVNTDPNAESFISLANPAVAIFLTLTNCSCYCNLLKNRNIPTFLIADKLTGHSRAIKKYGSVDGSLLKTFTHIFVFDDGSKVFCGKLGFDNVTFTAYPPFDTGCPINKTPYHNPIIERFIGDERFIFIGVSIDTDNDLRLVSHLANINRSLKCILVPRTISEEHLNKIKFELDGFTLLFSECDDTTDLSKVQVLVIDFIGSEAQICRYGSCAYIGGGSNQCLSNVNEALVNGLPMSFGPRFKRRLLSRCLINLGIGQIVRTPEDICKWVKNIKSDPVAVHKITSEAKRFVEKGLETTHEIYTQINNCL